MTELQLGAVFAGYRIEAMIGRGGMGLVYRAQDERLKRKVALKVLPPQKATDEAFRTRFIRESEAAASIDHPNIIPIFEAGEEAGGLFIAMRFVDGPDLKQYLTQRGPLSLDEATGLLDGVAGALDAAHAQGLVHRDVKPQNILISMGPASVATRHVYLTDFGLMKTKEVGREVTAEGQFVGTIDYVAPEQMEGRPLDGRADVYALGCVLYECLTGNVPFERGSDVSTMLAHMQEAPPSVRSNRPDLSPGIDDIIGRALAKSPEDRYPTCRDLTKALRQEVEVSSNDQRPEADRAVATGPPNGGTVVAPGGGAVAPAQGGTVVATNQASVGGNSGTVVAPSQPGVQAPAPATAPMNQQQPPPQGPS
ncbi:MAG: protein kinase domain-containing protein, partial [Actinomycetota bacterium]